MNINYTNNSGKKASIKDVTESGIDKFKAHGRHYYIDRDGQYPLFQVCCLGKCNTYYRTIGRYPEVEDENT
jgi:hypothetical protein